MTPEEIIFYMANKEKINAIAYERMRRVLLYGESWVRYELNEKTGEVDVTYLEPGDIYKKIKKEVKIN